MDECEKLFAELDTIHSEKDEYIKKLKAETKQKDDFIKKLKKSLECLEVEKDLTEQRNEYLHKEIRRSDNRFDYINKLEKRLIKLEQILRSRSLTRAEEMILRN
jgi:pyruvate/2-oxoacid:ferredoxin oxidoreductase alpha subunit